MFTRYPEPGLAKTRLIPALGPEGAAAVHAEMIRHTMATVDAFGAASPAVEVSVWHAGGDRDRFEAFSGRGRDYRPQAEGDLGDRMRDAFNALLADGSSAVLIGTDSPGLSPRILGDAFEALDTADLVLGPATDGGYYLIGLRRPAPALFERMPWGTAAVREETLARAARLGLRVRLLEELDDVDEPADLPVWYRALSAGQFQDAPWLSVVIPTLDEATCIAGTVGSVLRAGVEVIVADGGSTDATTERARVAGARVISAPRGRGPQMNAGAAVARGEALLFLHADTTLPGDYPELVRRTLASGPVALGAFRLRIDRPGFGVRLVEAGVRARCAVLRLPYGDQAFFLRKETFRALGGYPEIPLMEDVAIVRRARALGAIRVVAEHVSTSGRRWAAAGVLRMSLVNLTCALGASLGVAPGTLAAWRDRLSGGPRHQDAPAARSGPVSGEEAGAHDGRQRVSGP